MARKFWSGNKIIVVLFFPLIIGCIQKQSVISEEQYQEYLHQSVLVIPDSLMTNEQSLLKTKVFNIVSDRVQVRDNRLILDANRTLFKKEGIPTFYYDIIKYQIKETSDAVNRWIQEGILPYEKGNLDSLMNNYKREFIK